MSIEAAHVLYQVRSFTLADADGFACCNDVAGWSVRDLLESINTPYRHAFIATTTSGDAVGYMLLQHVPATTLQDNSMELLAIEVLMAHRRCGVARTLLAQLFEYAKNHNIGCCFLEVRENNYSARMLYQQSGFEIIGRRHNYYQYHGFQYDAIEYGWYSN